METRWRDIRTFGQALLLSICLYLGLQALEMVPGYFFGIYLNDLPVIAFGLYLIFSPIASILAGLWFLRSRVKTKRWVALDVSFVFACHGTAVDRKSVV